MCEIYMCVYEVCVKYICNYIYIFALPSLFLIQTQFSGALFCGRCAGELWGNECCVLVIATLERNKMLNWQWIGKTATI